MQALNAKDVAIDYAFMVTVEKFIFLQTASTEKPIARCAQRWRR